MNNIPDDDGASAFIPNQQQISFNGQLITLVPLTVLQAIQLSRSLKPVLPAIDRVGALLGEDGADGVQQTAVLVDLLADYGEALTEGVAVASGVPLQDVQGSNDIAGLIGLIAAIIRINTDFFAQQAAPQLAGLRNAAAVNGAGVTPSTPLSAPDTH